MSRHVNLRNDVDAAYRRVCHYLFNVLLRVKSTVKRVSFHHFQLAFGNLIVRVVIHFGKSHTLAVVAVEGAPCPFFGQQRIFFDFHTPALVIGQVPVELVQFVERHHVQQFLDLLLGIEVARYVQHQAAPLQAGRIFDGYGRHAPFHSVYYLVRFNLGRKQLAQRLDARNHSSVIVSFDLDSLGRDIQQVSSLLRIGVACFQRDGPFAYRRLKGVAGRFRQQSCQVVGCGHQFLVRRANGLSLFQEKCSPFFLHLFGLWNNSNLPCFRWSGSACAQEQGPRQRECCNQLFVHSLCLLMLVIR